MALTPVPVPPSPNVPVGPGVPALFRAPSQAPILNTLLLVADALSVAQMFEGPQWGVFDSTGAPVAIPDSVVSVDYRQEYRLSDFPIEQGGFDTYDKVAIPFDVRVRFAISGSLGLDALLGGAGGSRRAVFLDQIDAAAKSLDLYGVVTPDATYLRANIVHYDYRRERKNGVGMILVDVWLEQVRDIATAEFANAQQPQGASDVSSGAVQPAAPTAAQSTAALGTPPT